MNFHKDNDIALIKISKKSERKQKEVRIIAMQIEIKILVHI
jgi:hypothetical protein